MDKILGSWSGMRKYLEQEMIATCLKTRIRYSSTTYVGMDGSYIFEILVDNKSIKRFSFETVNTYFIKEGYKENFGSYGIGEYWSEFWSLMDKIPLQSRTEYTDDEFCNALAIYRNQDIKTSVVSENPIVKMFALLDRRIGKRILSRLKGEIKNEPEWIQYFFNLRLEAEHIK